MPTPKPLPYDDVLPLYKVRDYIHRQTGVMITACRLGRIVNSGELRTIRRPRRYGGKIFSRRTWVDEFIERNS
jgi:hypothetical protein